LTHLDLDVKVPPLCGSAAGVAKLADARDLKSYRVGLLKSLMTWAIPFVYAVFSLLSSCFSLSLSASIPPGLCSPLTL
jgi:hypothetical protein